MFDRILVTTDGSELSNEALQTAVDLARSMGSKLIVLHVIPDLGFPDQRQGVSVGTHPEQQHDAKGILENALQELGYSHVQALMLEAKFERVADVIAKAADDQMVDLIVMATHGRQGFDKLLLGSVAERVTHIATPPVMLVRAGQRANTHAKHTRAQTALQ